MQNQTSLPLLIEQQAEMPLYAKRQLTLTRGKGAIVWDDQEKAYIDCTTGIGVAILGHGHPALSNAVARVARRLMTASQSFSHAERARLEARLSLHFDGKSEGEFAYEPWLDLQSKYDSHSASHHSSPTSPGPSATPSLSPSASKVFLCNSGTEAMEAAIKLARLHTKRTGFVALTNGFHGRTMGALSLTHKEKYRSPFAPLPGPVSFVSPGDIEALKSSVTSSTAGVVVEIVQGEGGVRPVPNEFLKTAADLCRDTGALLIVDEIQTGCGRTGTFFAFEQAGMHPDITVLAKGLAGGVPIGALIARSEVSTFGAAQHGSTFGGNPLAASAANAVLDEITRKDLMKKAAEDGNWALSQFAKLKKKHSIIKEARGRGLLLGLELSVPSKPAMMNAQSNGLLCLQAGDEVIRLMPPLNIPRPVFKKAFAILDGALEEKKN